MEDFITWRISINYFSDYKSPEATLFRAGLKHDPKRITNIVTGTTTRVEDLHDKISYERVFLCIIQGHPPHNPLL